MSAKVELYQMLKQVSDGFCFTRVYFNPVLFSNETDFLAYFLAYLRQLCNDLHTGRMPTWMVHGHVLHAKFYGAVVTFFDALLRALHGFSMKKLFPYNVTPLIRRITVVEHLIGCANARKPPSPNPTDKSLSR